VPCYSLLFFRFEFSFRPLVMTPPVECGRREPGTSFEDVPWRPLTPPILNEGPLFFQPPFFLFFSEPNRSVPTSQHGTLVVPSCSLFGPSFEILWVLPASFWLRPGHRFSVVSEPQPGVFRLNVVCPPSESSEQATLFFFWNDASLN